jgi:FkbM family methyltransferase
VKLPAFHSPIGKVRRLPLRLVPHEATIPVLRGPMRGMKWIAGASTHGCWLGLYEPEFQNTFMQCIPEHAIVWDVGANVGYYSLLATRKARKVLAIEPLPANLEYLRRHIALNHLEEQIDVYPIAASNYDGEGRFMVVDGNRSEGSLGPNGELAVTTGKLDHLVSDPPALIKIDVEGNEYVVLEGAIEALKRKTATVLLALHTEGSDCRRLLGELGYQVAEPHPGELLATPIT